MLKRPSICAASIVHQHRIILSSTARHVAHTSLTPSSTETCHIQKLGHYVRFASRKTRSFQNVNIDKFFKAGDFDQWSSSLAFVHLSKNTSLRISQLSALSSVLFDRFRSSKPPKYTYDLLRGYCVDDWTEVNRQVPLLMQRREIQFYTQCPQAPAVETIGKHSVNDLGLAIYGMGRYHLEKSMSPRQPIDGPRHMQLACYYFEIAVMFGDTYAAVDLIRATSIGDGRIMLDRGDFTIGESPAKSLIIESAREDPGGCPWSLLATYMEIEFSDSKIKRHSANTLAEAIYVLLEAAHKYTPKETPARFYFDYYGPPHRYLLVILDHCLQNSIRSPQLSTEWLENLREGSLQRLASAHDPEACFILAVRDEEFARGRFGDLIKHAASGDFADAHWLFAIYRWRLAGVIPGPEDQKTNIFLRWLMKPEFGFKSAREALEASFNDLQIGLETRKDRDQIFLQRCLATAALHRYLGDHKAGADLLSSMLTFADDHSSFLSSKVIKELEEHLEDYISGGFEGRGEWTQAKCMDIIQKLTKPESTINALRSNPKFARPSTLK